MKWDKKKIEVFFREHLLGIFILGICISLTATLVFDFWKSSTKDIESKILYARLEPNNIPERERCPGAELKLSPEGKLGTRCSESEDFEYFNNHKWNRSSDIISLSFINSGALYDFQINHISETVKPVLWRQTWAGIACLLSGSDRIRK